MSPDFFEFFNKWSERNSFWLVSGSDIEKIDEQLPEIIMERAEGIFTCCGNQFWKPNPSVPIQSADLIYDNKFIVPRKLKKLLGTILSNSIYPHRYGNHIEDRGSMVNFSIVGRDCSLEDRKEFFEWDQKVGERRRIANTIKTNAQGIECVVGLLLSTDFN